MSIRIRALLELVAVALIAAIALGWNLGQAGMASGYVDPLLHAGAQDEAVYGHAAARMVRAGDWATPIFLERFMLNKPPLLLWAGAASMRVAGVSPVALRAPVIAAGVLCCVLVYWWLRRARSMAAGLAGVLLLLGTPLFQSMSRRFMTDALLTFFVVAAMFVVAMDPRLERRWAAIAFGVCSGAAVMTKSAAGLLPLLILAVYWVIAKREERPAIGKVGIAVLVAAIVAAPWHVYQFVVHRDWFVAEYIRFQLLGSGVTAPSRYTGDSNFWFYAKTLFRTDPILAALSLSGIPWLFLSLRSHLARLMGAWCIAVAVCLLEFGTRAAYYLLPLLPAMALLSATFSPVFSSHFWRGRIAWAASAALIIVFFYRADYEPATAPSAQTLDQYARLRRTNELVIVSPDDEFYASVVDLPKIRYVYIAPLDATKTSEFFYRLGMIVSGDQFCSLRDEMPVFEQRLHAWRLPEGLHPEATLIDAGSPSQLAALIACSPERDFLVPDAFRDIAAPDHKLTDAGSGRFLLMADHSSRRPDDAIAPGTVVRDGPR